MIKRAFDYVSQFNSSLWILSLGWLVSAIGFAASMPFIAIYFHDEFGFSMTDIGLFFGVMALLRSTFQAIGGEVSDRMERKMILVYSQYIRSIAFFGLSLSIFFKWGFWWVAIFLLLNSIFGAIFQPVANAMVSDILPEKKRLDGYAITRSAGNLGWALGPAIGGFLATSSYALLFLISAIMTTVSGLIVWYFLKSPETIKTTDQFKMKDLIAVKNDSNLAIHVSLQLILYLVVSQLIVPFSVYSVNIVGLSEAELGYLFSLNGLLVVLLQLPVTHFLSRFRLTSQISAGSFLYLVGYGIMGIFIGFEYFMIAIIIVTFGEVFISPPSLTLTSRLAPEGRIGRYMGIHGFFLAAGWSIGPLYGGIILDQFPNNHMIAWLIISSLALVSMVGYQLFQKRLPLEFDFKK